MYYRKTGVIDAISSLLLEWKTRALESLAPLRTIARKNSSWKESHLFFLSVYPQLTNEVTMKIHPDQSYPKIITFVTGTGFQVVFTLLAFCLIIFYNIAYFFYVPLPGSGWIMQIKPKIQPSLTS